MIRYDISLSAYCTDDSGQLFKMGQRGIVMIDVAC